MTPQQIAYQSKVLDALQIALAMEGDKQAFTLLYQRWHPRLLRHARRLVGHPDAVQDVMQDAAMAIARNIHRLKNPDSFGPWAYVIVRNRAANHIKNLQKHRMIKDTLRMESEIYNHGPLAPEPVPDKAQHLIDLIPKLPLSDQEVLCAYYVNGMSVSEISTCLHVPAGTVKSRLYKARAHLKLAYDANINTERK